MSEYEQQLNDLFDKLIEAFEKRNNILDELLDMYVFNLPTAVNESKDNIFKRLQKVTEDVNDILYKLDEKLKVKEELEDPEIISKKILAVANSIAMAKFNFNSLKKENIFSDETIRQNETLHVNCLQLANKIILYNDYAAIKLPRLDLEIKKSIKESCEAIIKEVDSFFN